MTGVRILGVRVTAQPYEAAVARMLEATRGGTPIRVHFATAHTIVEASRDSSLRSVFESAGMVATDGMPLVWVARRRGARDAERVCGPDVMLALCDRGREVSLRHYFLGGAPGVPEALAARLAERFPGLVVAGTVSPPFRPLSPEEDTALVAGVNAARPHVLWIGLGSPKQEFWTAAHESVLDAPLLLPVGAAFDFHSGRLRRAPSWMQRLGLEWLFRIAMEPRRLLGRYVTTNARFMVGVIREEVGRPRRR